MLGDAIICRAYSGWSGRLRSVRRGSSSRLGGATDGEEPTVPSLSQCDVVVGMDVSKNVVVAGVLCAGAEVPVVESFTHDEASVRRFFGRFERPGRVAACYE